MESSRAYSYEVIYKTNLFNSEKLVDYQMRM
jgi:hypothetical protein